MPVSPDAFSLALALGIAVAIWSVIVALRRAIQLVTRRVGKCVKCRYPLTPTHSRCSECGAPAVTVRPAERQAASRQLVLSIATLLIGVALVSAGGPLRGAILSRLPDTILVELARWSWGIESSCGAALRSRFESGVLGWRGYDAFVNRILAPEASRHAMVTINLRGEWPSSAEVRASVELARGSPWLDVPLGLLVRLESQQPDSESVLVPFYPGAQRRFWYDDSVALPFVRCGDPPAQVRVSLLLPSTTGEWHHLAEWSPEIQPPACVDTTGSILAAIRLPRGSQAIRATATYRGRGVWIKRWPLPGDLPAGTTLALRIELLVDGVSHAEGRARWDSREIAADPRGDLSHFILLHRTAAEVADLEQLILDATAVYRITIDPELALGDLDATHYIDFDAVELRLDGSGSADGDRSVAP